MIYIYHGGISLAGHDDDGHENDADCDGDADADLPDGEEKSSTAKEYDEWCDRPEKHHQAARRSWSSLSRIMIIIIMMMIIIITDYDHHYQTLWSMMTNLYSNEIGVMASSDSINFSSLRIIL